MIALLMCGCVYVQVIFRLSIDIHIIIIYAIISANIGKHYQTYNIYIYIYIIILREYLQYQNTIIVIYIECNQYSERKKDSREQVIYIV